MMIEVQIRVVVGEGSWVAHGSGSKSAISRSNRRNRIATEEESDGEWKSSRPERVEATFIRGQFF